MKLSPRVKLAIGLALYIGILFTLLSIRNAHGADGDPIPWQLSSLLKREAKLTLFEDGSGWISAPDGTKVAEVCLPDYPCDIKVPGATIYLPNIQR